MPKHRIFREKLLCILLIALVAPLSLAQSQPAPTPGCTIAVESLPVKFGGEAMLPTIAASLNGKPTNALVSFSAYYTSLNKSTLEKLGIPFEQSRARVYGIGESEPVYLATIDEIAVGSATGKGRYPVMNNMDGYGIELGTDYLLRVDMELSFTEKALRMVVPSNCKNAHLAYWSQDAISVPYTLSGIEGRRPEFTVKIDGKEFTAMLSTTIESSVIDINAAARLPGKTRAMYTGEGTSKIRAMGGVVLPVWTSEFNLIEIGDEKIANGRLNVMSLEGLGQQVILGMDFIRSHRILISKSQRKIYFSYTGGQLFNVGQDDVVWLKSEADAGNLDAMVRLGDNSTRNDKSDKGFTDEALAWYRTAAAGGHPGAIDRMARHAFWSGDFSASATGFRRAASMGPLRTLSASLLYLSVARTTDRTKALLELSELRPKVRSLALGGQILDFHQDKITREQLLDLASRDQEHPKPRLCEVNFHMGQAELLAGKTDAATRSFVAVRDACAAGAIERRLAVAELARLGQASP